MIPRTIEELRKNCLTEFGVFGTKCSVCYLFKKELFKLCREKLADMKDWSIEKLYEEVVKYNRKKKLEKLLK